MRTALWALVGSAIYATVSYNVFKDVPWSDWPTYTLNKAFALAVLILLVVAIIRKRASLENANTKILSMACVYAGMHVLLSLTLLSPPYYAKFFEQDKLTAAAGGSMALGAAVAVAMAVCVITRAGRNTDGGVRILAALSFVIGLHALLQGVNGWLAPQTWPGMMPPITLLSFLLGLLAVILAVYPKRRA